MHRIDGAGATSDNRFTDGDPASATAATVVTDDWLNAVQEEIVSVISDPAVTPAIALDKTKTNQLVTAIKRIISASAIAYSQATETLLGVMKVATQAQTNAGTDDATVVTPKKLKTGVAYSLGTSGYIGLPSWLGGFMVQWGRVSGAAGAVVQALPTSFSSNCYGVVGVPILSSLNRVESLNVSALAAMNFTCSRSYSAGGTAAGSATEHFYLAWGV